MTPEIHSRSPDGNYLLQVAPWEAQMSLWVASPFLTRVDSGECILRFQDPRWSLDHAIWIGPATVRLRLCRFPGNASGALIGLEVECAGRRAFVEGESPTTFELLEAVLDRKLKDDPARQ